MSIIRHQMRPVTRVLYQYILIGHYFLYIRRRLVVPRRVKRRVQVVEKLSFINNAQYLGIWDAGIELE